MPDFSEIDRISAWMKTRKLRDIRPDLLMRLREDEAQLAVLRTRCGEMEKEILLIQQALITEEGRFIGPEQPLSTITPALDAAIQDEIEHSPKDIMK